MNRSKKMFRLSVIALLSLSTLTPGPAHAAAAPAPGIPGEPGIRLFKKKKAKKDEAPKDTTAKVTEFEKLTKGAKTQKGLFTVYQNKEDYFFEIPDSLLQRDFLILNKLQRIPNLGGFISRGMNYDEQLIRFELDKAGKKLRMRRVQLEPLVPENDLIRRSVMDNYVSPLVYNFKVEAFSKDSSSVLIKVNDLYNGVNSTLNNLFGDLNMGAANKELSRIISIRAFPNNVVATSELSAKHNKRDLTIEASSSIVLLPRTPMVPRLDDPRIGYFRIGRLAYSDKQQNVEEKQYITRWKLEPKPEDREAYLRGELVEPQKPIVFNIDPATPEKWKKYMIKGVNDWQIAFEKAGFKNAIRAEVPTDSTATAADDINTSIITYAASQVPNAMGPHINDPRSGEIIDADIIWYHNVISLLKAWLTVQTGASNPEARLPEIPEELMGDAIRNVVTHEVGHSLGLRHNMRASYAIHTDSLRSKEFTDKFGGTASSIMDYARFNYVAQPGDGVTRMSPQIGPYDLYAIEYGYRWYDDITDPEKEKGILSDFIDRHKGNMYAYCGEQSTTDAIDPRGLTEDLGNDAIQSATYGIDNLKRIVPNILSWTHTGEKGQTYKEAADLYSSVMGQWNLYMYHVMANVGGIFLNNVVPGDGEKGFEYVPRDLQKKSLQFVMDEALTFPGWLSDAPVSEYTYFSMNSLYGSTEISPVLSLKNRQYFILQNLLGTNRCLRMFDNETENGKQAFTMLDMMNMLHTHVFGVTERGGTPDIMQRNLQKMFVDILISAAGESQTSEVRRMMTTADFPEFAKPSCCEIGHDEKKSPLGAPRSLMMYYSHTLQASDVISVKRGELMNIRKLLQSRSGASDAMSRNHYRDMLLRIETALGLNK